MFRRPQTEDERQRQYDAALVLLDLEFVIWAYNALDNFAETWEHFELYVAHYLALHSIANNTFPPNH